MREEAKGDPMTETDLGTKTGDITFKEIKMNNVTTIKIQKEEETIVREGHTNLTVSRENSIPTEITKIEEPVKIIFIKTTTTQQNQAQPE